MSRRNSINTLAMASLGMMLTACSPKIQQDFSFLVHATETEQEILKRHFKKDKNDSRRLEERGYVAYPNSKVRQAVVPLDTKNEIRREFPQHRITRVTEETFGFPEKNVALAQAYQAYVKDIITWARKHPALANITHPSLEWIVIGEEERRTKDLPVFIDRYRVFKRVVEFDVLDKKGQLETKGMKFVEESYQTGGVVDGFLHTRLTPRGMLELIEDDLSIYLSMGGCTKESKLLMIPLSEYLPVVLREGTMKHGRSLARKFGNNLSPEKEKLIIDSVLFAAEAITEAAAAHLMLEYGSQAGIREQLPQDIREQIKEIVTKDLPTHEYPYYKFVPAAFDWITKNGIAKGIQLYRNDPLEFIETMKRHESTRKK